MTSAMRYLGRSFGLCCYNFSIALLMLCSCLGQTNAFASTGVGLSQQHRNNNGVATTKDEQIVLPNGVKAQMISSFPPNYQPGKQQKPPILFLHGSFHGAWCWQEHYLPYFVEKGHPCVAFSWRGTGGTPAGEGVTKVKIVEDHCEDLQALLDALPSILGDDDDENRLLPIVVSHSMGGIIVMKYLDEIYARQRRSETTKPNQVFSGIVSMCSVPPSGNSKTTMRYLRRSLFDTYKITVGFVLKKVITDDTICRECFFGGETTKASEDGSTTTTIDDFGVSDEDLARYQSYMERDSKATLDVSDLGKRAPSKTADKDGRAPFLADLPPCLVIGAKDDFIVDEIANAETATYYGVDQPVYVDSPHDIMVGRNWKNGASALHEWIEKTLVLVTSKS
jgi:pimeloyl-ACP methyl ester carboxylesterase